MKNKENISKLLIVVGVLLVIGVGIAFSYYMIGVVISGNGATNTGETADLLKVKYDAGTSSLTATGLTPGKSASKTFDITITPGSDTNEVTYAIKLNITENTFEYCDDDNYNTLSNQCSKDAQELAYTLKDASGNIIATGNLTEKTGEVILAKETKTVAAETTYNYTLEIEFKETNADQNHNVNKTINGEVKVEFAELTPVTISDIIASKHISTRSDFSTTVTADTTGTVFTATDDDATSYYYAGAVTDNYVKFAGKFWRIIRVNGDGSIRLIYDGTSARANGTSSTDIQIGESYFNSTNTDNMYVGYMYTSGDIHGLGTNSTIKDALDNWFSTNLSDYTSYIDYDAGFCGDRTAYTDEAGTISGGGTGTTGTYYGDYVRYFNNGTPVLTCASTEDLYTMSSSTKGNKALIYPIGLINMNEVWMAGGYQVNNTSYYLYTGSYYWTMSPGRFNGIYAGEFVVANTGRLYNDRVSYGLGVRPVINLRADTQFIAGSLGTMESPYIVVGAE